MFSRLVVLLVYCVAVRHCQDSLLIVKNEPSDSSIEDSQETERLSEDTFVPTKEWQVIQEGQSIPRGLHVRLNLETGQREAKLMDNAESDVPRRLSPALEEALKNIATSRDEPSGNPEKSATGVRQKFRSLEEIKSEFAKRNLTLKSEQEIVAKLFEQLRTEDEAEIIAVLLTDLEYYLHGIDNAVYFSDIGGVDLLVQMLLTSRDDHIISLLCMTLGSASQSNAYVAKRAHELAVIPILISRLNSTSVESILKRSLFAMSAVMRSDPGSISSFVSYGGVSAYSTLLSKPEVSAKVKVRIYTLLTDIVTNGDVKLLDLQSANDFLSKMRVILGSPVDGDSLEKLLRFITSPYKLLLNGREVEEILDLTEAQIKGLESSEVGGYHHELATLIQEARQEKSYLRRDEL